MTATSTPGLRTAGPDDLDRIADLVDASFHHLDVIRFLVPDPDRRRPVARDWYRLHIEHAIAGAGNVIMTEDGTGAAVWFDHTRTPGEPEDYAKRLAAITGGDLPRFEHLDAQMDAGHPHTPHWYLLFLAVHPGRWGQGLGTFLMDHTHRELDAAGIAAYLEATGPQQHTADNPAPSADNRILYRRNGYADMDPATVAVTRDVDLHRMWRPAQPS